MNPHLYTLVIWGLLAAAEAILAVVILSKGATRRWPFLLLLAVFDLIYFYLTYTHLGRSHYRQYFKIFWYGQGARALISLGLIWDIARSVPGLKYVPKQIGIALFTFGLAVTIGAVVITSHHHPDTFPLVAHRALMIRECVTVAWMCFTMSLLGSISSLGMGWPIEALNVTGGFVISGMTSMIAANLMASWPKHSAAIDNMQNCVEIVIFLSWSVVLCRPPLPDEVLSESALNVVKELFEEHQLV